MRSALAPMWTSPYPARQSAPASPRFFATRRRTGSKRPMSTHCRTAVLSTRSRWSLEAASSSATSRSGSKPVSFTSRPGRTGRRPRSPNRSVRTSSPAQSPISVRARRFWCKSNIRSRFINPATSSPCGCRWWLARATIRHRWCRALTCEPMAAAGAQPSLTLCPTVIASHHRCSILHKMRP